MWRSSTTSTTWSRPTGTWTTSAASRACSKPVRIDHYWDRGLPDPKAADGDRANYPDGPMAGDALGDRLPEGLGGQAQGPRRPATRSRLKGVEARGAGLGRQGDRGPSGARPTRSASRAPPDQAEDKSDNARSLAIRFRLGRFDFLDCGDLTWNIEKELVCPVSTEIGPIDLYQVTHHGMDISNHPTLVRTIAPTVADHEQRPAEGRRPGDGQAAPSIPSIQAVLPAPQERRDRPDDNTDPALIANADPAGGRVHPRLGRARRFELHGAGGLEGREEGFQVEITAFRSRSWTGFRRSGPSRPGDRPGP